MKAIKWLFQKHAPLAIRLDGSLFQLKWMAAMLANCSAERYAVNKERMLRLSEYSRDCLRELRAATGIHYEERTRGTLQLFRTEAQLEAARRDIAVLEEVGVPYELLDRNRLATAEPALERSSHKLSGGLRLPNDETGDCHLFTTRLAAMAAELGVEFRYGQNVAGLNTAGGQITGVRIGDEVLTADRYVAAFGSYTRGFLEPPGPAGLSAQGLFADRAHGRRVRRAGVDHPGRNLQDRRDALLTSASASAAWPRWRVSTCA